MCKNACPVTSRSLLQPICRNDLAEQLLKTRIIANLVPNRVQLQFPIARPSRPFHRPGKLIKRFVAFSSPQVNQREIEFDVGAVDRVMGNGSQLDSATGFTN